MFNLKKIADLNVKPKTTKHLEENTGENLCNEEASHLEQTANAKL